MKRLVICCDGTWNRLDAPRPTNVVKIAQSVAPVCPAGIQQIVFYQEGVGTNDHYAIDRYIGGLFGYGLLGNIENAYRFLAKNYCNDDEIYIFGFSRGAYTARSLCGLIAKCGIPKRVDVEQTSQFLAFYRDRRPLAGQPAAQALRATRQCRKAKIRFLGVWDTVGSLGIPDHLCLNRFIDKRHAFHDTHLSAQIESAYHAVAIDEERKTFLPTLWTAPSTGADAAERYKQVWFPGHHSAVGGGSTDAGLSSRSLMWIIGGAERQGLAFAADCRQAFLGRINALATWSTRIPWIYRLFGTTARPVPDDADAIDAIVYRRWKSLTSYRPENLRRLTVFQRLEEERAEPRAAPRRAAEEFVS